MTKKRKMGWLGMCIVTLIVSLVVQIIGGIVSVLPISLAMVLQEITDSFVISLFSMAILSEAMSVTLLITHALLLLCFGLWYRYGCCDSKVRKQGIKEIFAGRNLMIILIISAGMCFLTNFALNAAYPLIPQKVMSDYENLMETAGFGNSILPTMVAVLIAPFGEEFIFRGVLFYYAKRAFGDMENRRKAFWIANCIQALCFGIFHFNIIQGTYAFFMGLALGYLAHRFKSLLPSMLGHMLINGLSSFAWNPFVSMFPQSYAVYVIGTVVFAIIVILGFKMGGPAEPKTVETLE